jgi:HAD superfamily hydrolase (TIGR01509 family)
MTVEADRYPQALLFDMDGTLIESGGAWFEGQREVLAEFGKIFTHEHDAMLHGVAIPHALAWLIKTFDLPLAVDELDAMISKRVVDLLKNGVEPAPGALRLLSELRSRGVPCALVSSSYRIMVDAVAPFLGASAFNAIVSGDEVSQPKPAPEPYLIAAARLGVDPARCVVVEDSAPGVRAGLAAGCTVIAVQHDPEPCEESVPHLTVRSIEDIDMPLLISALANKSRRN